MSPFNVEIRDVSDPDLGALLMTLNSAGYPNPIVTPTDAERASSHEVLAQSPSVELPAEWALVNRLEGQAYQWPGHKETYDPYAIYAGRTEREGTVHIALGNAGRAKVWGKDRDYVIAFLTSSAPQIPLVEFLATDDYEKTGEMVAIIRGKDGVGSRKMYGPADPLPDIYSRFRTAIYNDLIRGVGSWKKAAVVAHRDEAKTMLNHALVQARRRGDI